MKNKLVFGAGMAVGFVLGTRAGRDSYEQLRTKALELWNSPKVQDTVSSTAETIKTKAPEVGSLKGMLKKGGSGSDDGATSSQDSDKDGGSGKDSGTTGSTGPSGGDPRHIEETPFTEQDEDTRPDLRK